MRWKPWVRFAIFPLLLLPIATTVSCTTNQIEYITDDNYNPEVEEDENDNSSEGEAEDEVQQPPDNDVEESPDLPDEEGELPPVEESPIPPIDDEDEEEETEPPVEDDPIQDPVQEIDPDYFPGQVVYPVKAQLPEMPGHISEVKEMTLDASFYESFRMPIMKDDESFVAKVMSKYDELKSDDDIVYITFNDILQEKTRHYSRQECLEMAINMTNINIEREQINSFIIHSKININFQSYNEEYRKTPIENRDNLYKKMISESSDEDEITDALIGITDENNVQWYERVDENGFPNSTSFFDRFKNISAHEYTITLYDFDRPKGWGDAKEEKISALNEHWKVSKFDPGWSDKLTVKIVHKPTVNESAIKSEIVSMPKFVNGNWEYFHDVDLSIFDHFDDQRDNVITIKLGDQREFFTFMLLIYEKMDETERMTVLKYQLFDTFDVVEFSGGMSFRIIYQSKEYLSDQKHHVNSLEELFWAEHESIYQAFYHEYHNLIV